MAKSLNDSNQIENATFHCNQIVLSHDDQELQLASSESFNKKISVTWFSNLIVDFPFTPSFLGWRGVILDVCFGSQTDADDPNSGRSDPKKAQMDHGFRSHASIQQIHSRNRVRTEEGMRDVYLMALKLIIENMNETIITLLSFSCLFSCLTHITKLKFKVGALHVTLFVYSC